MRLPVLSALAGTAVGRALVALAALTALSACITPLPYAPNPDLVPEIGLEEIENRLKNTLTRCREPEIIEVRLAGERVEFTANIPIDPFTVSPRRLYVPLRPIQRIDVFPNGVVYLYQGKRVSQKFIFSEVDDAKAAADVLWSLSNHVRNPVPSRIPPPASPVRRPRQI